tara:strand:+ start:2420 stop:2647 length:228 start_codon:yes stop_codon:yes gene_type:complete
MKSPYKELLGILISGLILSGIIISLAWYFKPNPLENVEKRMDKVSKKLKFLTENEKKLKRASEDKEWNDLDKEDK